MPSFKFLRLIVAASVVSAVSFGCASARITPGVAPTIAANEGVAVLVTDSDARISSLAFQSTDNASGVEITIIDPGNHLVAFKAPEGTYCLRRMGINRAVTVNWANGSNLCFNAIAGKIVYTSHLKVRDYKGSRKRDVVDAAERMREEYPELTAKYGTLIQGD